MNRSGLLTFPEPSPAFTEPIVFPSLHSWHAKEEQHPAFLSHPEQRHLGSLANLGTSAHEMFAHGRGHHRHRSFDHELRRRGRSTTLKYTYYSSPAAGGSNDQTTSSARLREISASGNIPYFRSSRNLEASDGRNGTVRRRTTSTPFDGHVITETSPSSNRSLQALNPLESLFESIFVVGLVAFVVLLLAGSAASTFFKFVTSLPSEIFPDSNALGTSTRHSRLSYQPWMMPSSSGAHENNASPVIRSRRTSSRFRKAAFSRDRSNHTMDWNTLVTGFFILVLLGWLQAVGAALRKLASFLGREGNTRGRTF